MIPLATTTITVHRPVDGDPYEPAEETTRARGVPAHISAPTGTGVDEGGQYERIDAVLLCAPSTDVTHTDLVTDEGTDATYRVAWVRQRQGLGLGHTKAGLVAHQGAAAGG